MIYIGWEQYCDTIDWNLNIVIHSPPKTSLLHTYAFQTKGCDVVRMLNIGWLDTLCSKSGIWYVKVFPLQRFHGRVLDILSYLWLHCPFECLISNILLISHSILKCTPVAIADHWLLRVLFNSLRPIDTYMRRWLTIIGSDNGLSPSWRQAIIWTNAGILSIGTNFIEIQIAILTFSFQKTCLKVSSAKRRQFCLGLSELYKLRDNALWEPIHPGHLIWTTELVSCLIK